MSPSQTCKQRLKYAKHCLFRLRKVEPQAHSDTDLSKCLTTFDLTNLGIGSCLGAGIYVVAGQVAMNIAGPSVVISFTIAAFASVLSGLCYAEFGSRVPNTTGSAYTYSYHTVGEFIAFVIGWNLILEYMIGTAADARALSSAIDYMFDRRLQNASLALFGRLPGVGAWPDPLALLLTAVVTVVLALGVKESARYSLVFNVLNGLVAVTVIVVGSLKANTELWRGTDRFFPHGWHGVFAGAAACFYAFVGFDIIATTGEEARTASKSIPTAMAASLTICYLLYVGVSVVLTLMIPFGAMHSSSPLTESFDRVGFHWAKWMIGAGATFGLSASLLGSEFPLPRIIYAMASDGLLFRWLARVCERTETPVLATIVPGIFTALFAALFDLRELVEMMSIGTLLAYSLVCTSILLLRYKPHPKYMSLLLNDAQQQSDGGNHEAIPLHSLAGDDDNSDEESSSPTNGAVVGDAEKTRRSALDLRLMPDSLGCDGRQAALPTDRSSQKVVIMTVLIWLQSAALSLLFTVFEVQLERLNVGLIVLCSVLTLGLVGCSLIIIWQPQDTVILSQLHFKVPAVPLVPILAIMINVFLMVRLSYITWIRFVIWMVIGLVIYFAYGIRYSKESVSHIHDNNSHPTDGCSSSRHHTFRHRDDGYEEDSDSPAVPLLST